MAQEPERTAGSPARSALPVQLAEDLDYDAVPAEWLVEAASPRLADSVDRLVADFDWINQLALEQFAGPAWEFFVEELAKYGIAVIRGWTYKGVIWERCRVKGLGALPALDRPFTRDEIDELVGETVAKALHYFRNDVLMKRKWDYRKGASLRTFFIGQCLIRFSNVYRRWHGNEERNHAALIGDHTIFESVMPAIDAEIAKRVTDRTVVEIALRTIKDERVRKAVVMTALGHKQAEIAYLLGVSEKTVERMIANQRARFRRRSA
jgi:DNA-directed RNA polymerase specialized sigma24 family protein